MHEASEAFGVSADEAAGAMLLDVRRAGVFAQAAHLIPGARWCDPASVKQWAAELPAGREVLVYCVYGHEVGRATALRLRAAGLNARFLRGGIDAWQTAGRPVRTKAVLGNVPAAALVHESVWSECTALVHCLNDVVTPEVHATRLSVTETSLVAGFRCKTRQ